MVGTALTTIPWALADLFQGLAHCALAVGRVLPSEIFGNVEKWSGVSHPCTTSRRSSFVTRMCGCGPGRTNGCVREPGSRSHQVRRQHFASRLGQAERGSVRDCRFRPPQLFKMVLHNLLWIVASPELPRERGPGIAPAAPASTHGSPRSPRDRRNESLHRVQHHGRLPA